MIKIFTGNAMWRLVQQSDFVSTLVLLILLGMSIACWTIFFYKLILLRIKQRQMKKGLQQLQGARSVQDLHKVARVLGKTLPGYVLEQEIQDLRADQTHVSPNQWDDVQHKIDQTIDDVMHHEDSYMAFLSTSYAIATLLGLFGTVWGLVHAFIGISEQQSADISAVAPGIAEALITTLAGLMVAIPAQVMFNYLTTKNRSLEQDVLRFSDKVNAIIRTMVSH